MKSSSKKSTLYGKALTLLEAARMKMTRTVIYRIILFLEFLVIILGVKSSLEIIQLTVMWVEFAFAIELLIEIGVITLHTRITGLSHLPAHLSNVIMFARFFFVAIHAVWLIFILVIFTSTSYIEQTAHVLSMEYHVGNVLLSVFFAQKNAKKLDTAQNDALSKKADQSRRALSRAEANRSDIESRSLMEEASDNDSVIRRRREMFTDDDGEEMGEID